MRAGHVDTERFVSGEASECTGQGASLGEGLLELLLNLRVPPYGREAGTRGRNIDGVSVHFMDEASQLPVHQVAGQAVQMGDGDAELTLQLEKAFARQMCFR